MNIMAHAKFIREFECGHTELTEPAQPQFVHCYDCGEVGVKSTRLVCSMPKCENPATRVVRYDEPSAVMLHYCDDCTSLAERDQERVRTERRLIHYHEA